ncbi:MAG TPA: 50S ribosomal protein L5 [bacterium]|nr:50S ribosomal protein L5 [bacterium]
MARLLKQFKEKVTPEMMKKFNYTNVHQVPRMLKIVVNMGVGEGVTNPKDVEDAAVELGMITGQKPVVIRSKKAISNFKLKKNTPVGCKVTLRGKIMYEFFDRLVNVAIPRIRDFRGVPRRSFDGQGNYTLGVTDQIIFPEIDLDKIKRTQGMDITIVTSGQSDKEAEALLELMGMPFKGKE